MQLTSSRTQLLLALSALTTPFVSAFSDTSPYFLLSTSAISSESREHSILSSSTFLSTAQEVIKRCDADAYLIVSQPGLHIEDISARPGAAVHWKDLQASVPEENVWAAENVFSEGQKVDMGGVVEQLQQVAVRDCGAQVESIDAKSMPPHILQNLLLLVGTFQTFDAATPKVVRVDFKRLPSDRVAREKALEQHDAFLHTVIQMISPRSLVVIYASSPISSLTDEEVAVEVNAAVATADSVVNLELRSVEVEENTQKNRTVVKGGLFHRYQFFTPALFMGYLAVVFLIAVLYVGLTAVSSIEVSYGAFEKEMGPAAAKKQQ